MNSTVMKMLCAPALLLLLLLAPSCKESKVYKIGVSQCNQDDWRSKMNDEILREAMFHEDVSVEIRSADYSNEQQAADLRYFADNGFDIVVVAPNEAEELTPVVREIYQRGIPVIIFDRNIVGDTYTARIAADNVAIGREAAHYALHLLPLGAKALEIYGLTGSTPAIERHEGFAREFTAGGGRILASVPGNWQMEEAVPVVDSLLRLYDDVDVIYAHNDRMAIGAAEVARKLGRRDDIKIIGIDAAPDIGIKAVLDRIIDVTFLYPTEGHRIVRTALDILKGNDYNKLEVIPASSAVDLSNADILLAQNEALKEETDKIKILKAQIDDYWARHSSQTMLFYSSIAIIVLLTGVIFLVMRSYWQHRRHQQILLRQNRELEEQRDRQKELNERLEAATQSKLMFFTNVSHDLRTPLTLIAEPVAQLAGGANLTPQQTALARIADKNVRILQRLINQILDFRKYENGKLDLRLAEVDFGHAVRDWMESFRSLARRRDIKLTLSMPDCCEPLSVAIDSEKIERVFFNILSNAFKYTPDNGSIEVSVAYTPAELTFRVSDTGEGIRERDLGNIFDRFFQVDRVHPRGSGIGLSLSKAFVELHGGTISAESVLGRGSTFTVTLPVRHVAAAVQEVGKAIADEDVDTELAADGDIEAGRSFDKDLPLLLVIDDNRDIQRLVGELLGTEYNVITASGGREGLRMAASYVPDVVICDVMMPGMDGLECCRRLKAEVSTSHIPVLMLTACSMDEQRVEGYDSGADGYLSKPFNTAVLRARLAALIANRRRIADLDPAAKARPASGSADGTLPAGGDIDSDFYRRFVDIFGREMGNPDISVDSLAAAMGLERSQFYRKIKSLTNYSPVELMRRLRLRRARQMITSTDSTISEIAYATGFSTPAYFTRCYREAYGETPTETRAAL